MEILSWELLKKIYGRRKSITFPDGINVSLVAHVCKFTNGTCHYFFVGSRQLVGVFVEVCHTIWLTISFCLYTICWRKGVKTLKSTSKTSTYPCQIWWTGSGRVFIVRCTCRVCVMWWTGQVRRSHRTVVVKLWQKRFIRYIVYSLHVKADCWAFHISAVKNTLI